MMIISVQKQKKKFTLARPCMHVCMYVPQLCNSQLSNRPTSYNGLGVVLYYERANEWRFIHSFSSFVSSLQVVGRLEWSRAAQVLP